MYYYPCIDRFLYCLPFVFLAFCITTPIFPLVLCAPCFLRLCIVHPCISCACINARLPVLTLLYCLLTRCIVHTPMVTSCMLPLCTLHFLHATFLLHVHCNLLHVHHSLHAVASCMLINPFMLIFLHLRPIEIFHFSDHHQSIILTISFYLLFLYF